MRILLRQVSDGFGANDAFQSAIDYCHDTDGVLKCAATNLTSRKQKPHPAKRSCEKTSSILSLKMECRAVSSRPERRKSKQGAAFDSHDQPAADVGHSLYFAHPSPQESSCDYRKRRGRLRVGHSQERAGIDADELDEKSSNAS
jgi:hypothetical protein